MHYMALLLQRFCRDGTKNNALLKSIGSKFWSYRCRPSDTKQFVICYQSLTPSQHQQNVVQQEQRQQEKLISTNSTAPIEDYGMFEMLSLYKEQFGDCHVQLSIDAADLYLVNQSELHPYINISLLHAWVKEQRKIIKRILTKKVKNKEFNIPEKIQTLLHMGVLQHAHESSWHNKYNQLKYYLEKHGKEDPTCTNAKKYHIKLYWWVFNQRKGYQNVQNESDAKHAKLITPEKIDLLNQLNFIWNVHDYQWSTLFQELQAFHSEHGHCLVPQHFQHNPTLGIWVLEQRKRYQQTLDPTKYKSHDSLSKEQISKLTNINFIWNAQEARWMGQYYQLKVYSLSNGGNTRVPSKYCRKLSNWVVWQRYCFNNTSNINLGRRMTVERIKLLNDINFIWGNKDVSS